MTIEDADIVRLGRKAQCLLGPTVSVGYCRPSAATAANLLAEERSGTLQMLPRRQQEFAAGRSAIRMAAMADGVPIFAVPMGSDRAPVWPNGIIGSISHTEDACLAVISRDPRLASIGLDLEKDMPLPPAIMDTICLSTDRAVNNATCQSLGDHYGPIMFSVKEAVYKCQYPLTRLLFGFDALSVRLDPRNGTFEARFEQAVGAFPVGATVSGAFAIVGDHILTAAWIAQTSWSSLEADGSSAAYG